ncbi:uncharacterized protein LOC116618131 isoform X2 [Nematostella vectensis]|uniref:uncharacterized protein LOC116618131 isoform X2 n=1 Tax=Nematostella vectensis TaxID=45351 RepID=UPI002077981E|nr:uncharacterized protein LOC116618131 isoform X2 [Nematostella vectensis]
MDLTISSQSSAIYSWILQIAVLFCLKRLIVGDVYETIYWSPQNPKFALSEDNLASGKTYYEIAVIPMSYFNVLCPNLIQIERQLKHIPSKERLFENLWLVDENGFKNCSANPSKGGNRLLHQCIPNKPLELQYYQLQFMRQSAIPGQVIEIEEGQTYYFIATSDGSRESLNKTSGGNCFDADKKVAMRMAVYVCYTDFTDPKCLSNNSEKNIDDANEHFNRTIVIAKSQQVGPDKLWHILAIALAVAFAVSFLVNCIFLVVVCLRNGQSRSSCNENSYPDEEPLKSVADSKKRPHFRQSAAL